MNLSIFSELRQSFELNYVWWRRGPDFYFERTVDAPMSKTVSVDALVQLNSVRSVVPACNVELVPWVRNN